MFQLGALENCNHLTFLSMTIHVRNKVLSGNGAIVKKELNQGKDVSIVKPGILTSTVMLIADRSSSKLGNNSDLIVSGF